MKRFGWAVVFCLFAAALFLPSAVHAQAVATISGTVLDSSGAAVNGAQVTAHNEGTSQDRTVNSDDQGHYVMPLLPIGKYTIDVSANGFRKVQNTGISLEVGQ